MRPNAAWSRSGGDGKQTRSFLYVDDCVEGIHRLIRKRHDTSKPQGVRGRNSDNTRLREVLGWEPQVPLEEGLRRTYRWIEAELARRGRVPARAAAAR